MTSSKARIIANMGGSVLCMALPFVRCLVGNSKLWEIRKLKIKKQTNDPPRLPGNERRFAVAVDMATHIFKLVGQKLIR